MDESFGSDRVGGPNGKFSAAVEGGRVASFEERRLPPASVHEPYYQYVFTGHMPTAGRLSMESLLRGKVNAVECASCESSIKSDDP